MAKSSVNVTPVLGIVFICAGVVIIFLTILNYFQDGKMGIFSIFVGIMGISLGSLFYANGKKSKTKDE